MATVNSSNLEFQNTNIISFAAKFFLSKSSVDVIHKLEDTHGVGSGAAEYLVQSLLLVPDLDPSVLEVFDSVLWDRECLVFRGGRVAPRAELGEVILNNAHKTIEVTHGEF